MGIAERVVSDARIICGPTPLWRAPMEFSGGKQSYNNYGASSLYSAVADLLMVRLASDYGGAVESIYFTAFLKSGTQKASPTLEELYQRFHGYLEKLPKVTFRRKLKRIEIEFLSPNFIAENDESTKVSAAQCHTAAKEVVEALTLMTKRIKPTDDFDAARLLADAAQLLITERSLEEWDSLHLEAKAIRLALRATKTPWELLEIDWSQYHPQAKEILDDPFFWECANDLAPHGSDTGADLLVDYRRWDKRHRKTSPIDFLTQLFAAWDIKPIGWTITDEATVCKLDKERPIDLSLCNEATIALAFAVVKMRGACPSDIIQMAQASLTRTAILVRHSSLSDEIKGSWDEAVAKMKVKLESLAH
jgi:uncharacterized protein YfeS